ncbi:MAG: hypothetical protein AAB654_03490 [Acidobacteriota bacterium]
MRVRTVDLDRLRPYLRAVAGVAASAAEHPDPREVMAAVYILRRDVPRGLVALEGRP